MRGTEIAASLPANASAQREQMILDHVKAGHAILRWTPITIDVPPYRATFYVTAEPLMLGESWEDAFYPGVNAQTMQRIADYYNATLLTPQLVDQIWAQAQVRIDPFIATAGDAQMASTARFLQHSELVKNRLRPLKAGRSALVSNVGKYWVVNAATSLGKTVSGQPAAVNYGFFASRAGANQTASGSARDTSVVQNPGLAHNQLHVDYSQVVMLVARAVELCVPKSLSGLGSAYHCADGGACQAPGGAGRIRCIDIYDLAQDPTLSALVSHEGTVYMRLPNVPYEAPQACAQMALSALGTDHSDATAFGLDICGRQPPPPGPVGSRVGSGIAKGGSAIVGKKAPSGSGASIPARTHLGDKGSAVLAWQQYLVSQGFSQTSKGTLKPDGDHGGITEEASQNWERSGGGSSGSSASNGSGTQAAVVLAVTGIGMGLGWIFQGLVNPE